MRENLEEKKLIWKVGEKTDAGLSNKGYIEF